MSMRKIKFDVQSSGQEMLQHNPRLSNPMDPYTRAHKAMVTESKKTGADKDAFFVKMARCEWEGGLYHSETKGGLGDGLGPYIPGKPFRASVWDAAKAYKQGKTVSGAVFIDENSVRCPIKVDTSVDVSDLDAM